MAFVKDGSVYIPLQKSNGRKRMFAIVDEADFDRVSRHKWIAVSGGRTFYVRATTLSGLPQHHSHLHSFILRVDKGQRVDHRNGNGLDNRRENLREATNQQNSMNRSKYEPTASRFKGVQPVSYGRWAALITLDGNTQVVGLYNSEDEAARAYDETAMKLFGEFAKTNKDLGLYEDEIAIRVRNGQDEDTRKLGIFVTREIEADRAQLGKVVALTRHHRSKMIMYCLDTGRKMQPRDFLGKHPTPEEYKEMRKVLADYEMAKKGNVSSSG